MSVVKKIKNRVFSLIGSAVAQVTGAGVLSEKWDCVEGISALCRQSASDGIVLLKNDGVLPLDKEKTVALFGRCAVDYFYVGYGSGGDVRAPYKINLLSALKEEGVQLEPTLETAYEKWRKKNPALDGFWGNWPYNFDEMQISEEMAKSVADKCDVAVVLLGRAAGEDRENKLAEGSYYLTKTEKELLKTVTSTFKKTVVALDCGNVIDLSWVEDYDVNALVYAWQGGMESGRALCDVLVGNVNPSGKLTDTIARDYADYPSSECFGNPESNEYVEDVFVGYRYFETFAPEKVLFPFGYGLSYTNFEINGGDFAVTETGVKFTVNVKNVGKVSGKEVVQCYVNAPCGKLGKAKLSLVAFKKSPLLAPNQDVDLTFDVPYEIMASYDDMGITLHKFAYVLEKGEYRVFVGNSVRNNKEIGAFFIERTKVVKECTSALAPQYSFARMKCVQNKNGYELVTELTPKMEYSLADRINNNKPNDDEEISGKNYVFDDVVSGKITMKEFVNSLSIEDLVSVTCGEGALNSKFGIRGNTGALCGVSESLRKKGVKPIITTDGPSGIRLQMYATLLPCGTCLASTWDVELVENLTDLIGKEMKILNSQILLAPGMNIHRNPLCGRNFEYYSEDPVLSGEIASAYVLGIQKNGLSACPKHFACNNQETNRTHNNSIVSERALREIYLKGFEICIKKSNPLVIMTSYNKINGVWAHYNYDLCETILRKDFGYDGLVITDWWMRKAVCPEDKDIKNNAYRIRANVDVLMPGSIERLYVKLDDTVKKAYKKGKLSLGEIRKSATRVLRLSQKLFFDEKQ